MFDLKKVMAFISSVVVLASASIIVPIVSADNTDATEKTTELLSTETIETSFSTDGETVTETETTTESDEKKVIVDGFEVEIKEDGTATLIKYDGKDSDITLPEKVEKNGVEYTVTEVGKNAFVGNSVIKNVIIPDSYKVIYKFAFMRCSYLETVKLPDGLQTIGQSAFRYCAALKSIEIPESVTTLKNALFSGCISLKKAVINCNTTVVGLYMFEGCSSLEEVQLPQGITEYQDYCFKGCESLKEITIQDTAVLIAESAFEGCSKVKTVKILSTVETIGKNAFKNCGIYIDAFNNKEVHDFTIIGSAGSAAEKYASENSEKFITFEDYEAALKKKEEIKKKAAEQASKVINYGDVNGDNLVNSSDAVMILIEYARLVVSNGTESTFTDDVRTAADVNIDGAIDSKDAVLVLKYFASKLAGAFDGTMKEYIDSLNVQL